jgi:hypothetical protein
MLQPLHRPSLTHKPSLYLIVAHQDGNQLFEHHLASASPVKRQIEKAKPTARQQPLDLVAAIL